MEQLYKELLEREKYLQSLHERSIYEEGQLKEVKSIIVRVQQMLLQNVRRS